MKPPARLSGRKSRRRSRGPSNSRGSARGRPSGYSLELAEEICQRLADGGSLRKICEDGDMPTRETVRVWLRDNAEFQQMYGRARIEQAEGFVDRMMERAESVTTENAAACRIFVDAVKWYAAKLLPKVYGDRVETFSQIQAVDENREPMNHLELARSLAFLLTRGARERGGSPPNPTDDR